MAKFQANYKDKFLLVLSDGDTKEVYFSNNNQGFIVFILIEETKNSGQSGFLLKEEDYQKNWFAYPICDGPGEQSPEA